MALTRSPSVYSVGDTVRVDVWDVRTRVYTPELVKIWGFDRGGELVLFDYCGERQMRPAERVHRV